MGHMFRHPNTTQEKKYSYDGIYSEWEEEFGPVKYRNRDVPDAWDDIDFADWSPRSWKLYRKHQWKESRNHTNKDSTAYGKSMSKRNPHPHADYPHKYCHWRPCGKCNKTKIWVVVYNRYNTDIWYDNFELVVNKNNPQEAIINAKHEVIDRINKGKMDLHYSFYYDWAPKLIDIHNVKAQAWFLDTNQVIGEF